MNSRGHKKTLVPSHPGNTNAVKSGVHSPRLIQARASEIEDDLAASFEFSAIDRIAVREVAHNMAILEAIDRDLDERGLVDNRGEPRYLLDKRMRTSRQLDHWLAKIAPAIDRQSAALRERPRAEWADYVTELQSIAMGHDPGARTSDRLAALRELLKLGSSGTTSALEPKAVVDSEMQRRWERVFAADERELLELLEKGSGLGPTDR
jgi:hypothetical protein